MLAALGMFVFETDSALFDELARTRNWRHATTDRFGARPASQFTGPGADTVTLTGKIVPAIAGDYSSIAKLVDMADDGDALPLSDGSGNILGQFVIESVDEKHANLVDTGKARTVDFTLSLRRVD
ncbi:phage tail protein [Croceicoccus sp. BE223]|uniref:phage tail protein n=1 Tax=Croceicoccus sp. BE223 TaxID=2817716 RepID=UPI00285C79D8|nr:phage tail protein [Croceicoccus sp. BE223]MDR7101449.1 phage protein U [Croceicoccus sp. BE223]